MHLETLMYMAVQQVRPILANVQACTHEKGAGLASGTSMHSWPVLFCQQPMCCCDPQLQVKADFLAGPERPATPRGSQSAKEAASSGRTAACSTVSVPGGTPGTASFASTLGLMRAC
jgi:hypothetical protein